MYIFIFSLAYSRLINFGRAWKTDSLDVGVFANDAAIIVANDNSNFKPRSETWLPRKMCEC